VQGGKPSKAQAVTAAQTKADSRALPMRWSTCVMMLVYFEAELMATLVEIE
jgi:hypothetical protein